MIYFIFIPRSRKLSKHAWGSSALPLFSSSLLLTNLWDQQGDCFNDIEHERRRKSDARCPLLSMFRYIIHNNVHISSVVDIGLASLFFINVRNHKYPTLAVHSPQSLMDTGLSSQTRCLERPTGSVLYYRVCSSLMHHLTRTPLRRIPSSCHSECSKISLSPHVSLNNLPLQRLHILDTSGFSAIRNC